VFANDLALLTAVFLILHRDAETTFCEMRS